MDLPNRMYKRRDAALKKIAFLLATLLIFTGASPVFAETLVSDVKSAILLEPSTGTVIYEQNADEKVQIASVTKIMTMLIIMERIDEGKLALTDMVTASKNAQSYGGSTMFLEAGEEFAVSDMLKGIAVASANDGCVAMSEHIAGNEEAFVEMMNTRAKELGMENTRFANCNGLDDDVDVSEAHSTARDVAIMSAELIKHKKIFDYTTIWTDSLRDGKFLLANTNKLIRNYQGATGLKTGSTTKAGCCLSATAERGGMELVAVVLGAPTTDIRFSASSKLLDYGFSNYAIDKLVEAGEPMGTVNVSWGQEKTVTAEAKESFDVLTKKSEPKETEKSVKMKSRISAPVKKGDKLGEITFTQNGEVVKTVDIVAGEDVEKKGFFKILADLIKGIVTG
ncbi:MAG TPA: D-alanyl-D-alanine carboxypeptidase [Clostridiales bacterium]|nr:D-alanyl-D-alanine carboxypeptidase [Clostridiales bacterium]